MLERKEDAIQKLADEICSADDCDAVKKILEKKLWRKN